MITPVAPLWFRLPAPAAERWLALPRISTARGTEVCAIEVGLALKRATGAETIRRYVIVVVGLLVRPFMPPAANRSARTAVHDEVRSHLIDQTDDPVRGDLWMARGLQGSSVERGTVHPALPGRRCVLQASGLQSTESAARRIAARRPHGESAGASASSRSGDVRERVAGPGKVTGSAGAGAGAGAGGRVGQ
eukprot:scaffold38778_cov39-Phaeocystis_antarctica.AAC.1